MVKKIKNTQTEIIKNEKKEKHKNRKVETTFIKKDNEIKNSSILHNKIKEKREKINKKKEKKKLMHKKSHKEDEEEEEEENENNENMEEEGEEEEYLKEIEKEEKDDSEENEEDDEEISEKEEEEEDDEDEKDENDNEEGDEEEDENMEEENENNNEEEKDINNEKEKMNKIKEDKKEIQLLSNPINDHYYTFQYPKDLYTLLYTSLIFKWIDSTKVLILCNTPKDGYKIDIFLRQFRFNSIYLDKEMPINTNLHFYNQYLKNNYQFCVINLEYSEKSKNFGREILENTKIPITIIYFDCYSLELLEFHSFHPNTRAIYHFISNKDAFLDSYEKLNENISFNEFVFDREQMEHLRYRAEDMLNGIRKSDIKKEKMRKINIELLHSKNMEKFFNENPNEKENVIRTIQENTIKNFRPSVSFLPSYLIHNENNVIADAIRKEYKDKPRHNKNRKRNKKKKMEQYFEALDKGDGSQNLIKF